MLQENIKKLHEVADEDVYDDINAEAQIIVNRLGLAKRMDAVTKTEAFMTLKYTIRITSKTAYHADSSIQPRLKWGLQVNISLITFIVDSRKN